MAETFNQQLARLREVAAQTHVPDYGATLIGGVEIRALAELLRRWDAHMLSLVERNLNTPIVPYPVSRPIPCGTCGHDLREGACEHVALMVVPTPSPAPFRRPENIKVSD